MMNGSDVELLEKNTKMNKEEKMEFLENISNELAGDQRLFLIKVLDKYEIPYDKNRKLLYVVLSEIPDNILCFMKKFVDSCVKNKKSEEERIETMKAAKKDLDVIPLGGINNEKHV